MKKFLCVLLLGLVSSVQASNQDNLTINMEVQAINEINIADASITLTVNTAVAGQQPTDDTANTTYEITTNEAATTTKKLTGSIDSAMPANTTLLVTTEAPAGGGTSTGQITLVDSSLDLVTGIGANLAESGLNLDYVLQATLSAGIVAPFVRTFTFTLVDDGGP